jgi:ribosomal protein S18 acetylase RimI-like enzyme
MSTLLDGDAGGRITVGLLSAKQLSSFECLIPKGIMELVLTRPGDYIVIGAAFDRVPGGVLIAAADAEVPGGVVIVHIIVAQDFRRRGAAKKLLYELLSGLPAADAMGRLVCLFAPETAAIEDDPTCHFFTNMGFTITQSVGGVYRTRLGALAALPFWQQAYEAETQYVSVAGLPAGALSAFNRDVALRLNLMRPPFEESDLLPDVSHVIFDQGQIMGIAAVTGSGGVMELSWFYCDNNAKSLLPGLIRAVYNAAVTSWPQETPLRIAAVTDASANLAKKLCPASGFYPYFDAANSIMELQIAALAEKAQEEFMTGSKDVLAWWKSVTE